MVNFILKCDMKGINCCCCVFFVGWCNFLEIFEEVIKREKESGIWFDCDVDIYMKVMVMLGFKDNFGVEYILRSFGFDVCVDIVVGDEMWCGIFGG